MASDPGLEVRNRSPPDVPIDVDKVAQKYYSSLYREYAVCDLKHYKSGNVSRVRAFFILLL